jgi:hypothetical protein
VAKKVKKPKSAVKKTAKKGVVGRKRMPPRPRPR